MCLGLYSHRKTAEKEKDEKGTESRGGKNWTANSGETCQMRGT
jgi:hypothetical protein